MRRGELALYLEHPHPCPYLGEPLAANLRFTLPHASPALLERLLEQGFRHFGASFFRPACPDCAGCAGLRIPVSGFSPSRSQRRSLERNRDLVWNWGEARVDDERLELLNRFQAARTTDRGWALQHFAAADYATAFFWDPQICREMTVRDTAGRLLAVGIVDHAGSALSGVYHYHDPDQARRGLGTWMILQQLAWGAAHGYTWLYLGLWNPRVPSLAYKARFRPCEELTAQGWVRLAPFPP